MVKYSVLSASIPSLQEERGRKGHYASLRRCKGSPLGHTLSQKRTKNKGQREETCKIRSSQVALTGHLFLSGIYCLPTVFALTGSSG